jgi:hypothetical protein
LPISSRKKSVQVERRYVVEAVKKYWPNALRVYYNHPITPISNELRRRFPGVSDRYFTKYRRYVDAVVITDQELLLIEAKIRRPIDGLGQLLLYRHYAAQNPELKPFASKRIIPVLMTPKEDPYLIPVAQANGFRVMIVKTDNSQEYLQEKRFV